LQTAYARIFALCLHRLARGRTEAVRTFIRIHGLNFDIDGQHDS
jgi:hypothetical protein